MVIDNIFISAIDYEKSIQEIFYGIDIFNCWHMNNYTVKYTIMRLFFQWAEQLKKYIDVNNLRTI